MNTIRLLAAALVLAGTAALLGCAVTHEGGKTGLIIQTAPTGAPRLIHGSGIGNMEVGPVTYDTTDKLTTVKVQLINLDNANKQFEIRPTWKDNNGSGVQSTAQTWSQESWAGLEERTILFTAPTPEATHLDIYIRRAARVHQ